VIPAKERAEFMAGYKAAAGFAIENLNKAPQTIPKGALPHHRIMRLLAPS
jgi:hypothetical protein